MYNENNSHLELIVKDGTVTIPSIFMFDSFEDVTIFLNQSADDNCTVIFENENVKILPNKDDFGVRAKIYVYSAIVSHREIGNAYLRYLGNISKMSWDKVK